jgi:hypothetical protein
LGSLLVWIDTLDCSTVLSDWFPLGRGVIETIAVFVAWSKVQ